MQFWEALLEEIGAGRPVMLLQVVESIGSSPGRAGFRMFVNEQGKLCGSIGGGSMEHKLVELAQALMPRNVALPLVKRQIHRSDVPTERSGMICSGEQTVAFVPLGPEDAPMITSISEKLHEKEVVSIAIDPSGLKLSKQLHQAERNFHHASETEWLYHENLGQPPRVLIFGGGHVGLAISQMLSILGFEIHVMDDRPGLNTMESNSWANQKTIIDYGSVGDVLEEDPDLFVVLASFGYRTDEQLLRQLIRKRFRYIGMLGSEEKVRKMFDGMKADGFTDTELARVHAPIGLPIHSRTPEEIAISVAAQIIQIRNA